METHAKLGVVVHVTLNGLSIKNPRAPGGVTTVASHLPLTEEALNRSLVELEGIAEIPDYRAGYDMWRKEFDRGDAGVFTLTIAEAVDAMEIALNQQGP